MQNYIQNFGSLNLGLKAAKITDCIKKLFK